MITRAEVKNILQISDTGKDDTIETMIPIVRDFVIGYCNNKFLNDNKYYTSNLIGFYGDKVIDGNSGLATFSVGMNIYITGSDNNDGAYTVKQVADGSIRTDKQMTLETAGESITIYQVQYPEGLKLAVANMVGFQLNQTQGVTSESIGDYSVSYSMNYPDSILQSLRPYKKVKFV